VKEHDMDIQTTNEDKQPLARESYAEQVYRYIKDLILSGELRQGDKVVEDKIAKRFGVSRTPIREALTRLQAYGLVYLRPRSYAEVVRIGPEEAMEIAQLRLHLEKMAFRLLCAHHDTEAFAELRSIAEEAQEALLGGDKAAYFEADSHFHQTAAERCGNSHLAAVSRNFDGKVQLLRIAQDVPIERLEVYMRQHFDLLQMLEERRCNSIDELLRIHIVHDLASPDVMTGE
jgi:DNA-binding GntR family transcriptional regulator